ncbi:MAG: hypothetical protein GX933_04770 [Chloroflexi bacterium]|nr:hypothetical protein [Chloroflexota bacterium]
MKNNRKTLLISALLTLTLVTACNMPVQETLMVPTAEPRSVEVILTEMAAIGNTPTVEPLQATLPPEDPDKTLTVCAGSEPQSLFIYHSSTRSGWSVLEAIYDGPFDWMDGVETPVIFESVDWTVEDIPLTEGMTVMDGRGQPELFQPESGNGERATAVQVQILFKLKANLHWSDGEPLTAQDSVFSYKLSASPELTTADIPRVLTESYEAVDDTTVLWKGIPGYIPTKAADVFWIPLPEHQMETIPIADLNENESVNRTPLGWGAYQISSWQGNGQIILERNPYYYGLEEGIEPYFDKVVYRFFGKPGDNNLAALRDGSCDVIDLSVDLQPDTEAILEDVRDGKMAAHISPSLSWEQLSLNLDSLDSEAVPLFADQRTRQGMLACLDRESLIREVLYGQSEPVKGFYPQELLTGQEMLQLPLEVPLDGPALLTEAGWLDNDEDPTTPRIASGIKEIPDGTPFSFAVEGIEGKRRIRTFEVLKEQLGACGIELTYSEKPAAALYLPGPDGLLFGRKYQAALLAWASGLQTPCALFSSTQIPGEDNGWIGTNPGGYNSDAYDIACQTETSDREKNMAETGESAGLLMEDLPVIPLFFYNEIGVSNLQLCGIRNGIGVRSLMWNIESLSRSTENCSVSQWKDIYASQE